MRPQTLTRRAITVAAASFVVMGSAGVSATQADNEGHGHQPQADEYVALGDSFSAGTGTRQSIDDCYRSPFGYPALIAESQGLALDYQACSGATTQGVLNNQLGTLSASTALVTITIGGNDLGFADVITQCALPGWASDCFGAIEQGRLILQNELPARLDQVYGVIAGGAPNADVKVGGYPLLFNGQDCHALTFFSADEMAELNAATVELNDLTANRTAAAGFSYVDPIPAFLGHAVCDNPEWINNLSMPVIESFHPNRDGNVGYAEVFWPGSTSGVTVEPQAEPAWQEQVMAQSDVLLDAGVFSDSSLRQAQIGGLDRDSLLALEASLGDSDPAVVQAALVELAELDAIYEANVAAAGSR